MFKPFSAANQPVSGQFSPVLTSVSGRIRASKRPSPVALSVADIRDKYECPPLDPKTLEKWDAGIRSAEQKTENVIEIYGSIGEDWWSGTGITAKSVSAALRSAGGKDVEVRINSPGGDMFEGIAIYNVLAQHPGNVTVKIMGLAASAASIIAMAGNEVKMGLGSFLMIHNCWVMGIGNQFDFRELAEWLAPYDDALRDIYIERTGSSEAEIEGWMKKEKTFSASEAIDHGFADDMLDAAAVTQDKNASAAARALNEVREIEWILCRSGGMSRSQARAKISALKGKPGAAPNATRDAGNDQIVKGLQGLLDLLKSA